MVLVLLQSLIFKNSYYYCPLLQFPFFKAALFCPNLALPQWQQPLTWHICLKKKWQFLNIIAALKSRWHFEQIIATQESLKEKPGNEIFLGAFKHLYHFTRTQKATFTCGVMHLPKALHMVKRCLKYSQLALLLNSRLYTSRK